MARVKALDRKMRACIHPAYRVRVIVEAPTDATCSTDDVGLESMAVGMMRFLSDAERCSKDRWFSDGAIPEGTRVLLSLVGSGKREERTSRSTPDAPSLIVPAKDSEHGRALQRDGVQPSRPTSPFIPRQLPIGCTSSVAEVSPPKGQSGGGADALQGLSLTTFANKTPQWLRSRSDETQEVEPVPQVQFLEVRGGRVQRATGVAVNQEDGIVVAYANNQHIQILDQEGGCKFLLSDVRRSDEELYIRSLVAVA